MKDRFLKIFCLSALAVSAVGLNSYAQTQIDEEALVFGYCGNYATSIGSKDANITIEKAAIEIPADLAQSWNGATLTKVNIGYGVSSVNEVTVFLSRSLDTEPFYTQTATMTVEAGWNMVVLDTPYDITGESFFVGYSTKVNSTSDKPIGIDNIKTSDPYGGWVNTYNEWEAIGKFYGNVCIRLSLIGDNLPQYSVEASSLTLPALVEVGKNFTAEFLLMNEGLKTVDEVTLECSINDESIKNFEVAIPDGTIKSGETGRVVVSGLIWEEAAKDIPVSITVVKVNGHDDESMLNNQVTSAFNCAATIYFQQIAVEEFTGTWCGFCPLGIVGMNYMREKYGDKGFNGIAVHNGDPMQVASYSEFATEVTQGNYPSAIVNRSIFFLEPSSEALEGYYNELTKNPASAQITLEATYSPEENVIYVESEAEFSFPEEDAAYAVAYVIIENNFGPYTQTNYFSGGAYGELPGWSNAPAHVENTYFNEVARDIDTTYGIEGSVPTSIDAATPYPYSKALSCENVKNISECEVVALLLDTSTGIIVNSCKAEIENAEAGVEGLFASPEDDMIRVFNLQGGKVLETKDPESVKSLEKGIYIVNGKKYIMR